MRLGRVEERSAARHRAGVPVLELPAGDEDERILGVGTLVGGNEIRGNELAAPVPGREILGEYDRLAGIVLGAARIGDRRLLDEEVPRDAADGVHRLAHLVVDLRHSALRTRVIPLAPEPRGDLLAYPP